MLSPRVVVTSAIFSVTDKGTGSVTPFADRFRRFGYAGDGISSLPDGILVPGLTPLPDLIPSNAAGDKYSANVTAFVASPLADSKVFAGFVIAEPVAGNQSGFNQYFVAGAPTGAPSLTITYEEAPTAVAPESTSATLFATGLVVVMWRHTCRRRHIATGVPQRESPPRT